MALFLSSFLVLFLETALIRWMPAYVRLLAYFSNFILSRAFLASASAACWRGGETISSSGFPLIQFAVILAVDQLRLEVALPSTSTIYFSSGTSHLSSRWRVRCCCANSFASVAALFVVVAHRMGRELSGRPPLRAYVINLLGSLTGVAAFALVSWLELPPSLWFGVRCRHRAAVRGPGSPVDRRGQRAAARRLAGDRATAWRSAASGRLTTASPFFQDKADTVVEVNHIFHQSMAPVAQKEYFYQWPYTVFGRHLRRGVDPWRRQRH